MCSSQAQSYSLDLVVEIAVHNTAQSVVCVGRHILVSREPPDCPALNIVFFPPHIGRNLALAHRLPKFIEHNHRCTPHYTCFSLLWCVLLKTVQRMIFLIKYNKRTRVVTNKIIFVLIGLKDICHSSLTFFVLYSKLYKLFALHYILLQNARSTVQTEQAIVLDDYGAGPFSAAGCIFTHLRDSCMFRRCVFLPFLEQSYLSEVPIREIIIAVSSDKGRILL